MRPWWFCNCRNVWCWLDALLECRSRWVCDRHDRVITGDSLDGMRELQRQSATWSADDSVTFTDPNEALAWLQQPDRSTGAKRLAELRARIAGR